MRRSGEVIDLKTDPFKIDARDRELLNILTLNSRTSLSSIAKVLRMSVEGVTYRFERLWREGVITDAFAVLDPRVLGIKRYVAYVQFRSVSEDRMKKIRDFFLAHKHVNWLIETSGKWEFIVMFETINEEKYEFIRSSLFAPVSEFLNTVQVTVVTNFVHASQRYIQGMKRKEQYDRKIRFPYDKELSAGGSAVRGDSLHLDEADILILKELHRNARVSLTDLGKLARLSKDAVDDRIRKLIVAGVIKGFLARLNYHTLGFQYTTIMLKLSSISEKRKKEFLSFVSEDHRFFALLEQIGVWDVSLMMFFKNPEDLRDFLIVLKEKFSDVIQEYDSVLHFNQYLYTYLCDGVVEELLEKYKE